MTAEQFSARPMAPVMTINAEGNSPFVLVCDHASNRIPERYGDLGLGPIDRLRHIAWDPGALDVSLALVKLLDAPLIHSTVSRLVIDCNRTFTTNDLIPRISETTEIPGNFNVGDNERARRIADYHDPFHAAIEAVLNARLETMRETILVAMHSFTPVFRGVTRPWPIGLIHGVDQRYTRDVYDALKAETPDLQIGWNEPYAAMNGVTYTLEHHGDGRALRSTMVEIRHDEILEGRGIALWSGRLARSLEQARHAAQGG